MSKSYLSGAAKRKARQERATNTAKLPKIDAFLKPENNAQEFTVDDVTVTEEMSDRTAAEVTLDQDTGTGKQDLTSENTETLTVQTQMEFGNTNEDISGVAMDCAG